MSERLKDCTAIITGGARGQGAAEARRFVEEGAFVVIADVLDSEGQALAKELGDSATFQHLDVTDEDNWDAVVSRLTDEGRTIDVLVNNAGILLFDRLTRSSREDFERVMEVNCTGVFLGIVCLGIRMVVAVCEAARAKGAKVFHAVKDHLPPSKIKNAAEKGLSDYEAVREKVRAAGMG